MKAGDPWPSWPATNRIDLGNTACENCNDGIQTGRGSAVSGNIVSYDTGCGLHQGSEAGYRENVITIDTAGTVTGGINTGGNVCNGSLTCP